MLPLLVALAMSLAWVPSSHAYDPDKKPQPWVQGGPGLVAPEWGWAWEGLQFAYLINEGGGAPVDVSPYKQGRGTLNNGPTWVGTPVGQGLQFVKGSSQWVDTGWDAISGTGARTVVCTFLTTDTDGSASDNPLFGWGGSNGGDNGAAFQVSIENGVFWLRIYNGATSWGSGFNDGDVHTLAISAPASATLANVRMVADGKNLGLGSGTAAINTRAGAGTYQSLRMAVSLNTAIALEYLTGTEMLLMVYDRQLTVAELQAITADPFGPFRPVSLNEAAAEEAAASTAQIIIISWTTATFAMTTLAFYRRRQSGHRLG